MSTSKVLTGILSAVFFLTLVSSARADMSHAVDMSLEKQIYAERHNLTSFDSKSAEAGYLYAAHFEDNNGKHIGFSVVVHHTGPRLGMTKGLPAVTENPEPTAMVLLGTGLAAVGAFARRKNRRRARK